MFLLIDKLFNASDYHEGRINKSELIKENQFATKQHRQALKAMAMFSIVLVPFAIVGYFFGVIGMELAILIALIGLVIGMFCVLWTAK